MDLPSRILLRSQGRTPMDLPSIQKALHEALGTGAQTLAPLTAATPKPTPVLDPAPAAAPSMPVAGVAKLDNFFDTYGKRIEPFDWHVSFDGAQVIREGWLRLNEVVDTAAPVSEIEPV